VSWKEATWKTEEEAGDNIRLDLGNVYNDGLCYSSD
jgi:hypothetical protein